jgi:collagenase-like PrtC family protease
MKLSVACNFDPQLVDALKEFPVYELYGKMTSDVTGGGRASFTLPDVGRKKLRDYVKLVHEAGIEFNYLLNASCLENVEFTRTGQKDIRRLLDWLAEMKVDSVTLNHPLLLKMIKKGYPFKTRIGVFAAVNTVQKARSWEEEGADCICLEDIAVNRDFKLLSRIREAVKCDLQLLANNSCFYSCWMSNTHMNMLSHASQSKHKNKGFYLDYCIMRCSQEKFKNPINYIRASWIRPEDLSHYRKIGYENFKIVERNSPTSLLKLRVQAYHEGKYEGNLLDLVQPYGHKEEKKSAVGGLRMMARYFFKPRFVNPFKLMKLKKLAEKQGMLTPLQTSPPVVIRNEDLNGFISPFLSEGCGEKDCSTCRYCHAIAEKHVKINPEFREECLDIYSDLTDDMESGKMWA